MVSPDGSTVSLEEDDSSLDSESLGVKDFAPDENGVLFGGNDLSIAGNGVLLDVSNVPCWVGSPTGTGGSDPLPVSG